MGKITESIKHLIIINVILFIAPKLFQGIDLQSLFFRELIFKTFFPCIFPKTQVLDTGNT